jgi:hypothetical protein
MITNFGNFYLFSAKNGVSQKAVIRAKNANFLGKIFFSDDIYILRATLYRIRQYCFNNFKILNMKFLLIKISSIAGARRLAEKSKTNKIFVNVHCDRQLKRGVQN